MNEFTILDEHDSACLNRLCQVINDWAEKKGWNEAPDSVQRKSSDIALMHSELSECLEYVRQIENTPDDKVPSISGESAELADVLIRIFHYCGMRKIDLGEAVRLKHLYNITRPYKHGKAI